MIRPRTRYIDRWRVKWELRRRDDPQRWVFRSKAFDDTPKGRKAAFALCLLLLRPSANVRRARICRPRSYFSVEIYVAPAPPRAAVPLTTAERWAAARAEIHAAQRARNDRARDRLPTMARRATAQAVVGTPEIWTASAVMPALRTTRERLDDDALYQRCRVVRGALRRPRLPDAGVDRGRSATDRALSRTHRLLATRIAV